MKDFKFITLFAKRAGQYVHLSDKSGKLKAKYPPTGYRPTKATKQVTLNCWRFNVIWV
jgi:hypothetical protein